jgi:hypothetical protein
MLSLQCERNMRHSCLRSQMCTKYLLGNLVERYQSRLTDKNIVSRRHTVWYVIRTVWVREHSLRTGINHAEGLQSFPAFRPSSAVAHSSFTLRMASSGMLRRVALVRTDVSEELSAPFIRVTKIGELRTTLALTSNRRTQRTSVASYS